MLRPISGVKLSLEPFVYVPKEEDITLDDGCFTISPRGVSCLRSPSRNVSILPIHSIQHTREDLILIGEVGRGASGRVYKCLYLPTLTTLAVKCLRVDEEKGKLLAANELKALFAVNKCSLRKSQGVTKAPCGYISAFYDAYCDPMEDSIVCIVLEYLGGGSLQDIITDRYDNPQIARPPIVDEHGCSVNERAVAIIAYSVLRALQYLHSKQIVHRDVKPSNIMCSSEGHVKLTDFGIMRELDRDLDLSSCQTFKGSIQFMAPERLMGQKYGAPSDIWGLGVSLFMFLTGEYPHGKARSYWSIVDVLVNERRLCLCRHQCGTYLFDFVNQCLKVNPSDRPSVSLLLQHPFLLLAQLQGTLTPPAQPSVKGLVPLKESVPKTPEQVAYVVGRVMEWQPGLAEESSEESSEGSRSERGSEGGSEGGSDYGGSSEKESLRGSERGSGSERGEGGREEKGGTESAKREGSAKAGGKEGGRDLTDGLEDDEDDLQRHAGGAVEEMTVERTAIKESAKRMGGAEGAGQGGQGGQGDQGLKKVSSEGQGDQGLKKVSSEALIPSRRLADGIAECSTEAVALLARVLGVPPDMVVRAVGDYKRRHGVMGDEGECGRGGGSGGGKGGGENGGGKGEHKRERAMDDVGINKRDIGRSRSRTGSRGGDAGASRSNGWNGSDMTASDSGLGSDRGTKAAGGVSLSEVQILPALMKEISRSSSQGSL